MQCNSCHYFFFKWQTLKLSDALATCPVIDDNYSHLNSAFFFLYLCSVF